MNYTDNATPVYCPVNPVRIVTATTLFDGHDAAINLMRRLLQATGGEVIHLGHNRSVAEIVQCAIQEDAQAIAVTSYQGGHLEYFKYMHDLLAEQGAGHIKIFGGGGGTILPSEIEALQAYGVCRIYSPDDGRRMGLQGMINDVIARSDFPTVTALPADQIAALPGKGDGAVGRVISFVENHPGEQALLQAQLEPLLTGKKVPVLGVTGTGGAGKSSLIDELVRRFLREYPGQRVAIVSVDPTRKRSGGALLGDRIRLNSARSPRVYMRSLATRHSRLTVGDHLRAVLDVVKAAAFDLVIVETSGAGQADSAIVNHADVCLYVMTGEYGAPSQLEKIDMLDFADVVAVNKSDKGNALDALREVRRQYAYNHGGEHPAEDPCVFGTNASFFNDGGVNQLYGRLMRVIREKTGCLHQPGGRAPLVTSVSRQVLPAERSGYLHEIVQILHDYNRFVEEQSAVARKLYQLEGVLQALEERRWKPSPVAGGRPGPVAGEWPNPAGELHELREELGKQLSPLSKSIVENWPAVVSRYREPEYAFRVRDQQIRHALYFTSLSQLQVPKISLPKYHDWGDILAWSLKENVPGEFPYTAGVFPMKREGEEPTRLTAGEGGPERSNRRFHYLTQGLKSKRISTAHDSVTLYGHDPDYRADVYGKIGSTGVSVSKPDDSKMLYSGFNLSDPGTSVNLTINGPAPMVLAFFLNAAIDQQCELYIRREARSEEAAARIREIYALKGVPPPTYQGELPAGNDGLGLLLLGVSGDQVLPADVYEKIKRETLAQVRGTVQCDILKEDQAQNTCIFSTPFALKMMADIQEYFTAHRMRNFYSVSISGYHIAEAGANPITQLAFTLANGFTYIEYYLSRGMQIDDFAPNLSFFFSNGMEAEYAVLGRVARRIWAKVLKYKYGANERSQKLKYHIQTSGRSLHAQEVGFNDIRTTLQALYAVYDNCNSLHTNANDEAISLPTEESVRRALAIQMIIDKELGLAKNQNCLQGSFVIEELTDLLEEAVIREFDNLSKRGGVLGAMETMYQRSKIQEESMHYEMLKHSGELPIIGVNTFTDAEGSPTVIPEKVVRITNEEYDAMVESNLAFRRRNEAEAPAALDRLRQAVLTNANVFECLMEVSKVCTLGQMTEALYEVGGEYRRNM